jgi:hypothetical protein
MRDRTLITHSLSSPIAVSSGDAIGYSIVAAPTALQIARASVTPDELEGVIYTDGFQYDDEDDLEDEGDSQGSGNGARYIFINLARTNSDEDIQILSTAMFSPLITVTMRETPEGASSILGVIVNEGESPTDPTANRDATDNQLVIIVGGIVGTGVVVIGLMLLIIILAVVFRRVPRVKGINKKQREGLLVYTFAL